MENKTIQIEVKLELPDDYEKKCRICLLEGTLLIFSEASDLLESIQFFGGINISEDDTFPKYLCKSCYCLLQNAILFRKKAQETNSQLLLECERKKFSPLVDVKNTPEGNEDIIKSEGFNSFGNDDENASEASFKSESSNVCENNVQDTPEGTNVIKSESSNVSRNVLNTPKRNKVTIKSEGSRNISNSYSKKIYECASCKIEFSKRKDYTSHNKSKHSHIQCTICQKLAPAQRYKRHLASHETDSYVICEICGKLFKKGAMAKHLLLHNNNLPFPCKLCPYRGRYYEALRLHMRKHTGQKPYSCDICQMNFITKSNLNRHSLKHSKLRSHKCGQCNKAFSTNRDMVIHIKKDHDGIKEFECKICGNKYGAKRVLRKHEITVHKRDKMIPGRKPLYLQPEYKTQL
ncbi:zinc finger protein 461-like isoform X3 [Maniola jurtina]|uniref:zinc finger protein 461-like isoform X2 n=1 Tax=Maniola jurtina TaxID=191418 RepID=UPI001E688ECF|nr:zinc finger protein 461-like isoform X2 [Maniola jurtina]XP_045780792.1 zinc finger protein 461-like isoform X3 [Maniola jurtina]